MALGKDVPLMPELALRDEYKNLPMANAITAALLPRLSYYYDNDRQGFYKLLDKGFQRKRCK